MLPQPWRGALPQGCTTALLTDARYLLWDLETFYIHSLPAGSPVFQNLPVLHTDRGFSEWGGSTALGWTEIQPELKVQVVSETVSITHSVSWGLDKKKLLQGYKCFKAWSAVSNVKFKACWGRPDDVIGGKLQHCFKISLWFSSISQTFINCSCKFWKCWNSHASSPLQDCRVLIGAFLCAHSKKIHPAFPLLPSWRRKKHSFDKQKQEWRAWGRVSERHKDEKDKRNPKGRSTILKMVADVGEKEVSWKERWKNKIMISEDDENLKCIKLCKQKTKWVVKECSSEVQGRIKDKGKKSKLSGM